MGEMLFCGRACGGLSAEETVHRSRECWLVAEDGACSSWPQCGVSCFSRSSDPAGALWLMLEFGQHRDGPSSPSGFCHLPVSQPQSWPVPDPAFRLSWVRVGLAGRRRFLSPVLTRVQLSRTQGSTWNRCLSSSTLTSPWTRTGTRTTRPTCTGSGAPAALASGAWP